MKSTNHQREGKPTRSPKSLELRLSVNPAAIPRLGIFVGRSSKLKEWKRWRGLLVWQPGPGKGGREFVSSQPKGRRQIVSYAKQIGISPADVSAYLIFRVPSYAVTNYLPITHYERVSCDRSSLCDEVGAG